MASTEKSFLEKITDSIDGVSYKQVKNMFNQFKKNMGKGAEGAIKDTASMTEKMLQKFKRYINKLTSEKEEAKAKTAKPKGPSQAKMMGGAKGPSGPLGAKLEDKKKNKNKKSMMKRSSYDPRKANRAGQKMGQR